MPRMMWDHTWYRPGDWTLPDWWTAGPPVRNGRATYEDQEAFYSSRFVREVLGHTGGMTVPPATGRK